MKNIVELTPEAQKKIKKLPHQVVFKLKGWVEQVELLGVRRVMQIKGYHDEPLKGKRKGQRSIRLNKAYRAFYRKLPNGEIEIIEVFDVNKHEY
ncbi:type II toxin-antitoxin system mRNA interferase toxin, RelE/StbE family [Thiotrichales bacterium 19S3-7]|nr:type II toxin-antitoxin system mRNA interferase toxin, RelE/StbE family [Thiotrichales bacterium 19S3-7]MCF6803060.1 type II toxin-antitoxin system mRNA interferase toxin, RelE/StbE family [Thiotrichales bacterium 19S3-11]